MNQFLLCSWVRKRLGRILACGLAILYAKMAVMADGDLSPNDLFERRIRPVLVERCYGCHSSGAQKLRANLRLDSRAGLMKGGEGGVVIVPGHPERSRLIQAIRYGNPDLQMPPKGRLSDPEIANFETWVQLGAPWPEQGPPSQVAAGAVFDLESRRRQHWAWHPIQAAPPAEVKEVEWPRNPVDQFVLAALEQHQLRPASAADRRTLLRRICFDLTGLPPDETETEAFLSDSSPEAYERVVDRLLSSPRFGERWARHWLDLVRYAETLGHEFDYPNPNAWRYRDYVIRAFNADVPYDHFVMEHLAGDLLPRPRRDPVEGRNESIIGTGFYWLGQRDHSPVDVRQHQAELIDNQIDVLSKTFLGLTVSCARCHDHKFDAISTRDYYSLYGILSSSRYSQASIDPPEPVRATLDQLARRKREVREAVAAAWLTRIPEAAPCLAESSGSLPNATVGVIPCPGEVLYADAADRERRWAEWRFDGEAFPRKPAEPGDFAIGRASKAVDRILTAPAFDTSLVSRRLQGTLRSPTFTISNRFVHVLAAGRSTRINLPVDDFTMIRDPIYGGLKRILKEDEFEWITIDVEMWKGHRAYLEFSDVSTPDPADDAHRAGFGPNGYLALRAVVFSDEVRPPELRLEATRAGPDTGDVACDRPERAEETIERAVRAWASDESPGPTPAQAALLNWLVQHEGLPASPSAEVVRLTTEYARLEEGISDPVRVLAMADGTGLDENVFVRGSYKTPGERAPRRFLEAIAGAEQPGIQNGSGRLELAQWMTNRANPFLARVMVNRVWLHLFGRGLVSTPDDFGALGQAPSYPALLDWLAEWYRTEGEWSTKRLIRLLVISSTYRMTSYSADASAEQKDPENLLWHRMPVRRLEGEAIRDAVLAVSGRLDPTLFGAPVPIHLTEFMEGRGRPATNGPLDGAGRRTIYLEVRRNFVSPMMRAFDMPVPFSTVGRRTVSNVPAQSLILMNDPFVAGQAQCWAEKVLSQSGCSAEGRVQSMYEAGFSRPASAVELKQALEFLQRQTNAYRSAGSERKALLAAWADLAQVLFNVKEFIFVN